MTLLRTDLDRNERLLQEGRTGDMVSRYPQLPWAPIIITGRSAAHRATVDGFWIDRTPVTNRQFKAFVKATGHVTFADPPDPKDYPGALPQCSMPARWCCASATRSRPAQLGRVVEFF